MLFVPLNFGIRHDPFSIAINVPLMWNGWGLQPSLDVSNILSAYICSLTILCCLTAMEIHPGGPGSCPWITKVWAFIEWDSELFRFCPFDPSEFRCVWIWAIRESIRGDGFAFTCHLHGDKTHLLVWPNIFSNAMTIHLYFLRTISSYLIRAIYRGALHSKILKWRMFGLPAMTISQPWDLETLRRHFL